VWETLQSASPIFSLLIRPSLSGSPRGLAVSEQFISNFYSTYSPKQEIIHDVI
jgi:hypothetical protein